MSFYSRCAVVPAVVGVAMYLLRSSDVTVDTDPYLPFFSVFMSMWAVLFLVVSVHMYHPHTHPHTNPPTHTPTHTYTHTRHPLHLPFHTQYWRRQSSVNSFKWSTYNLSLIDQLRPGYHGDWVIDPVTRRRTKYYKSWKRKCWYVFSFLAMLPLLGAGLGVMTLSLNLNGYVKNKASPIYVASLAKYAQPVRSVCVCVCVCVCMCVCVRACVCMHACVYD